MMKRSATESASTAANAKRAKTAVAAGPSGTPSTLQPRNSFRGLPLELREAVYASVFDDLVSEPQHPYSEYCLNSRFETYLSLLLVDKATSEEAQSVFINSGYAKRVTFYFEDAVSLFDLQRRAQSTPFLQHVDFVLRSRTDLDPLIELDDGIQWMNETLIGSNHNTFEDGWSLVPLIEDGVLYDENENPLSEDYRLKESDHSHCRGQEACQNYQQIIFPPMLKSLRLSTAVWKMQVASKWNVRRQKRVKRFEEVSIAILRGKVRDVSFDDFPVRNAKMRLISFLISCPWPSFRERYKGKYPLSPREFQMFLGRKLEYNWPISDIETPGLQADAHATLGDLSGSRDAEHSESSSNLGESSISDNTPHTSDEDNPSSHGDDI